MRLRQRWNVVRICRSRKRYQSRPTSPENMKAVKGYIRLVGDGGATWQKRLYELPQARFMAATVP